MTEVEADMPEALDGLCPSCGGDLTSMPLFGKCEEMDNHICNHPTMNGADGRLDATCVRVWSHSHYDALGHTACKYCRDGRRNLCGHPKRGGRK